MSKWWSHRVVQGFLLQYPLQAAKTRWHFYCVAWWESQVSLCENEGTVYLLTYINLEPGFFGVYWVYLIYSYILLIQNTYILYVVVFFIPTSFRVDPISVPRSLTVALEGHVSVRLLRMDTETPWLRLCYWSSCTDLCTGTMNNSKTILMLMICQSPMFFSCIHPLLFFCSAFILRYNHIPQPTLDLLISVTRVILIVNFTGSIALFGSRFREETLNLGGKRYLCLPCTWKGVASPPHAYVYIYIYI